MIRLIQRRLIIPRGDSGSFSIPVNGEIQQGDAAIFAIFDPVTKTTLFEKRAELSQDAASFTIYIGAGETNDIAAGKYKWDIRVYHEPIYDLEDAEKIIGGTAINSYYAAYSLPICEIREVVR